MSQGRKHVGWRVCSTPKCGEIHEGTGRCPDCRHLADASRPSGAAKYGKAHRTRFRPGVLQANRETNGGLCVGLDDQPCTEPATVADHWPLDRDELTARGLDPDDPQHGRALCARHHNVWTARTKPAGFRG